MYNNHLIYFRYDEFYYNKREMFNDGLNKWKKNGRLTNIIRKTNIFYNFNYANREMLEDELIKNTGNEGCILWIHEVFYNE